MSDLPSSLPPPLGIRVPKVLLQWSAPSHHNHDRSTRWYITGGIIVLLVSAYGILTGAWSLTLVTLLVGGSYYLVRREVTPMREIRIEIDGVQFEDSFTPWNQCGDFWLVQTPLFTDLHITRKGKFKGDIRIQTADIDPTLIRTTVSQFIPLRADQKERLMDVIIRLCKL